MNKDLQIAKKTVLTEIKALKKLSNKNLNALVCVAQIKTPKISMNL